MKGVKTSQEQCGTHSQRSKNVSLIIIIIIRFKLYGHALCYHSSNQPNLLNVYIVADPC